MTLKKFLQTDRQTRKWAGVITWLVYVIIHIVLTVLLISDKENERYYASRREFLTARSAWILGNHSPDSFATIAIAVLLGISAYAYLMSRRQVDFYESQPVSGKMRFFGGFMSSLITFGGAYICTSVIGSVIAVGMGASGKVLFPQVILQIVRSLVLFASVFGVSALACMLTGNLVITCMAVLVLLFYEPALRMLLINFAGTFLATWSGVSGGVAAAVTSPIAWAYRTAATWNLTDGILIAVISLVLAWTAMRMRPREAAGSAVVFRPVRVAVKAAVCLMAGLVISVMVYSVNSSVPAVIICTAAGTIIVGCVMEVIFTYNFKSFLGHMPAAAAAAAAAVLIFCGYRYDWTGYDSWIPAPESVTSAYADYSGSGSYTKGGYAKEKMELTDIENLNEVLSAGEKYTRGRLVNGYTDDREATYSLTVTYRMKNGDEKTRSIMVPDSTDQSILTALFDSEEFREGYFPAYKISGVEENAGKLQITYSNGDKTSASASMSDYYSKIREAWIADMEKFSWEDMKKERPVGEINIEIKDGVQYTEELEEYTYAMPVYSEFTNTISALKEAGIYMDSLTADEQAWQLSGPFNEYLDAEENVQLG